MKSKLIYILCAFSIILADNPIVTDLELGRNNDPKTIDDIKPFKLWRKKATWAMLSTPGMRFMTRY